MTQDPLWDTRHLHVAPQKGNSRQQGLPGVEKSLDASRVKALRLPPVMLEVQEEAVPAEATVVAAKEVVVVAEGDVAEEEAEAEETMTMTTPMPHLLSDQVPLHVDEGDNGF